MFTVTQRLLLHLFHSTPAASATANPIHPRHSPASSARGLERGRGSLISTLPRPKARESQTVPAAPDVPAPTLPMLGDRAGPGA